MRKLMWFALGFGGACAFCAYCYVSWILAAAVLFVLLTALFLVLSRRRLWLRAAAAVCLGVAVGLGWFRLYDTVFLSDARAMDGETERVTIAVRDYGYSTDYGCAFDGTVTLNGRIYSVRVYLDEYRKLEPGNRVRGCFRFRLTTGGLEDPSYHRGKGIFLIADQEGSCVVQRYWLRGLVDYPAIWRRELKTILRRALPGDVSGFARGLLLGDKTGIDYETSTAFKISGVSHIIAVSGLHLSILFGLVYLITGRRRVLTAAVGIPIVLIFMAIAGFTPSVTRAGIMQILVMLAMLLDREYDPPTSLAFAALTMLAINPLVITSVSFQLSMGCMIGIFLFAERIRLWMMDEKRLGRWKGRLTRWFSGSVSVTLSAMVFTTPLVAVYFGTVSLIGVITNLLVLWVITVVFYGLILLCAVGCFSIPAARILGMGIAWLIRYVLLCTKVISKVPLAAVYTKSAYIVIWLISVYCLLAVYLCLWKKPALLFAGLMTGGLCAALVFFWAEPQLCHYRMTMLDVGQGQAILLQSEGKSFLVDCGGDDSQAAADITAETLLSQGISRLDGILLTHYDRDHSGGLPYLLTRIRADHLFLPYAEDAAGVGDTLRNLTDGTVQTVMEDTALRFGGVEITLFAPVSYNSDNESSMCILFRAENCDILITGDRGEQTERMLLSHRELPELEVLVAGHHGSKTSTSRELLEATNPEYVLISVGEDNPYGHPAPEVLERLVEFGCVIFRTDENGTIIYWG